jgi:hypothetical protein
VAPPLSDIIMSTTYAVARSRQLEKIFVVKVEVESCELEKVRENRKPLRCSLNFYRVPRRRVDFRYSTSNRVEENFGRCTRVLSFVFVEEAKATLSIVARLTVSRCGVKSASCTAFQFQFSTLKLCLSVLPIQTSFHNQYHQHHITKNLKKWWTRRRRKIAYSKTIVCVSLFLSVENCTGHRCGSTCGRRDTCYTTSSI